MAASSVAPALEPLRFFEGTWEMELSDAGFLREGETMRGSATFDFLDDGRLLAFRQGDAATWIIGRDDSSGDYTVLYSDGRGVSRVYSMTLEGESWKMWRDDETFSQRFTSVVAADHDLIRGHSERRSAGQEWEHDTTSPSRTAASAESRERQAENSRSRSVVRRHP